MKLCFPVESNNGLESRIFDHFGSAPAFLVVDTESRAVTNVLNRDRNHVHGSCNPLRALGGEAVDAIVVGGIGAGALMRLQQAGIKVLQSRNPTVSENLGEDLQEFSAAHLCGGHGHGHGCAH